MRKNITEIVLWLTKFRVNFTGKIPQSIGKRKEIRSKLKAPGIVSKESY